MTSKNRTGGCCCQPCDCCIQQIYVCVCGVSYRVILCSTSGKEFSVSACCDCGEDDGILYLNYICDTPETLALEWTLICGEDEDGGTIDITDLCDGDTTILEEVTAGDCTVTLSISDQELCCNSCVCCEDDPATATVTLTDAVYTGDGSTIYPATPQDFSGTYPLTFTTLPTSDIHQFDDKIFWQPVVFSSNLVYFYFGIQVNHVCDEVTGLWSLSAQLVRYQTEPMPPPSELPTPPFPGPYTTGPTTPIWYITEFPGCLPTSHTGLTLIPGAYMFGAQNNDWIVDVDIDP